MIKIIDGVLDADLAKKLHQDATSRQDIGDSVFSGYDSINFLDISLPQEVFTNHFPELLTYRQVRSWGFIYESGTSGVPPHADPADLNLNIWLTPDECIDDHNMNGLNIWMKNRPKDWSFASYNANTTKIIEYIGNAHPVHIPYKFNRAVLFSSSLFHATNNVSTIPGRENRRVSYTFLFQK